MKKKLIAGNWKMHKTASESIAFLRDLDPRLNGIASGVVVFPPATSLALMAAENCRNVKLGAQNIHFKSQGAFTGEISAVMVRELADYVLVGHSERRELFGESDDLVNRKLKAALAVGLKPVCCLGETLDEREQGRTREKVLGQLEAAFRDFSPAELAEVIIAYEPVWAIGTGRNATSAQAQEIHALIRNWLAGMVADPNAVFLLYGGSAKPENSRELLSEPDIDGLLVGGASLNVESFYAIIENSPV